MVANRGGITLASSAPSDGKVKRYRKGDVLVSNIRPYFKKIWHASHDGACSNDVLVFEATKCDPNYLFWVLSSDAFFDYMMKTAKGTKMPRGDKKAIMGYQVGLPPVDKQKAICEILESLQGKIALNNQLNGYLEELFFLRFREILESGGESWTSASLLDIADYKNGLAMQKYRPSKGDPGLPVLKIRELGQGYCGNDSERCSTDIDGSVTIDDGDLVFSWSGTLLLRFWAGGRAGLNQHLFKVTSEQYPSWFYYAWTKHHLARFVMLAKDRATTMGHIKRSALAESSVVVPPARALEQQTKLMQPIVDEIVSNMVENRKLALLRDALLPKLMSGEIDVSGVTFHSQGEQ